MHKANHLKSTACLLGVLMMTACGDASTESPAASPPLSASPAPEQSSPSSGSGSDVGAEKGESVPSSSAAPAPDFSASNCQPVAAQGMSASGDDGAGSVAANTQDDDLATRWSALGKGAWLTLDLGATKALTGTALAWHQGSARQNQFTLSTSTDGTTFTQAYAGTSALTAAAQTYAFPSTRQARYVRVTVNGNTVNDWASITEARACGEGTSTPAPSTSDSGPTLPRLPYLQSVGPTSALVAFRTSTSCTPFVRFGEGGTLSRSASATALGYRHAVKLDGLSPGRTYTYVVEACGSVTGARTFQTATGADTSRVRFTAMGDFGTGGSAQRKVLDLLGKTSRTGEFLLTLGDNAYSFGTEAEFQSNMFTPMADLLRKTPLFPTPGNHEYETDNAQPYLDNFYLPANNSARTERYYSFDWGPVHFVSLDSNCLSFPTAECTKAIEQDWLAKDLAATTRPWKIVFFHHPPWSSGDHGSSTSMRSAFAPLFERYGVDLVLTGHDHNYERSLAMVGSAVAASGTRGIPYLVVGSGGATMRPFVSAKPSWSAFRDDANMGYLDVTVDGGTLTAKFIVVGDTVRDSLTLTKAVTTRALPAAYTATSLAETPPGPTESPYDQPEFLRLSPVPPADTLEAQADEDEPAHAFAHDVP